MREANEGWAAFVTRLVQDRYDGNASALAKALDVSASTVIRWIDGATPEIARLKQLHQTTGIPMVRLLVAAGALDGEAEAEQPPASEGPSPSDVLDLTPLEQSARFHLLNQYEILRDWSEGRSSKDRAETSPVQRPLRAVARKRPPRPS